MNLFTFDAGSFAHSFLSILFEGIPFLLLGALVSGVVDAYLPPDAPARLLPKNQNWAILVSGLLGLLFPMCECGSVMVVRRLIRKGLPVSCATTYMLASPIVNPVVILSTLAAFSGRNAWVIAFLRLALGYLLSIGAGFFVMRIPAEQLLQPGILKKERSRSGFSIAGGPDAVPYFEPENAAIELPMEEVRIGKWRRAVQSSASDFLDVAFLLVLGAAVAALFNTSVNQAILLPLAKSPSLSILAMMVLAFLLALCSTSDAFIAASFVAFPFPAKLAFMVFGAMFDIKLLFLYGLVYRKKFVLGLLAALFVIISLICLRLTEIGL